ncbi:hypothetical protein BKA82DRAFT_23372 [Pisolithus tinctorius]|uniref:Uncharacterized protein n=1 Tax=Pisolithus tinctorius Marx 270 TaxID=870435 RepID=A0A0C3JGA1_PISTI|nr:hypothetical protein BKA82DRAFT_23372 [Pisolithus tinctorius]KIO08098.1 hypothetical protein M404DRAFT_23372 [Pisolithus tinctorius Marx 270]
MKPDKLSSEPPKEVTLEGNSRDEASSGDEVKPEATVEVAQRVMSQGGEVESKTSKSTKDVLCQCASPVEFERVKSAEVEGETSGVVSENEAAKRGLGEEATDETDGQDITAKEMANLKAGGGDTEICHTSNRLKHEQLEGADNERPARIVEAKVPPSNGAPSYPQTWRTELEEELDSSCVSSTMDQPSSSTDVPQHYVDDPSGNTEAMGGSTDVLQHHTGDPGHRAHERSTHTSAQDLPISPQAPAKHPREGVGTTAAKQLLSPGLRRSKAGPESGWGSEDSTRYQEVWTIGLSD